MQHVARSRNYHCFLHDLHLPETLVMSCLSDRSRASSTHCCSKRVFPLTNSSVLQHPLITPPESSRAHLCHSFYSTARSHLVSISCRGSGNSLQIQHLDSSFDITPYSHVRGQISRTRLSSAALRPLCRPP